MASRLPAASATATISSQLLNHQKHQNHCMGGGGIGRTWNGRPSKMSVEEAAGEKETQPDVAAGQGEAGGSVISGQWVRSCLWHSGGGAEGTGTRGG